MKFLVDNALSPWLAIALNAKSIDAVHVSTLGLAQATDENIFLYARKNNLVIVSADTDFGTLLSLEPKQKPSFILFRHNYTHHPQQQLAILLAHLHLLEEALNQGCIVVFDGERVRLRYLPL